MTDEPRPPDIDIDHPAVKAGAEALFGHHPERGGPEREQAVFAVIHAVLPHLGEPRPICLACHRHCFGMNEDIGPPHVTPVQACTFCTRPTNHGLYVRVFAVPPTPAEEPTP